MEKNSSSNTINFLNPIIFGLIFGFLLQKGGVTKYNVLIGSLLLEDFTVWIIILTAILVGMIGIFLLEKNNLIEKKVKETKLGPNIIGGLIFGIGFGLSGYCPGTGAAAIGQGNTDALVSAFGLIIGSYIYAELSALTDKHINPLGNLGEVTFYSVFKTTKQKAVQVTSIILVFAILILNYVNGI